MRPSSFLFPAGALLLAGALAFTVPLQAAEPAADPSAKLREQLKAVMLQLRSAQTESANAQAAAAAAGQKAEDLEKKAATLGKQNAALEKQAAADKAAAAESIATLEAKAADREKRIALLDESLGKWKAGYEKAAAVANAKEAERAKTAAELTAVRNTLALRERQNIALSNTALEILARYEGYALGKALAAKEPFTGTTRVKVENLVQDYKDDILDNRAAAKPAR